MRLHHIWHFLYLTCSGSVYKFTLTPGQAKRQRPNRPRRKPRDGGTITPTETKRRRSNNPDADQETEVQETSTGTKRQRSKRPWRKPRNGGPRDRGPRNPGLKNSGGVVSEDDNIPLLSVLLSKVLLTLTSEWTVYVSSFKLIIYWYKIRSKDVNSCFFLISMKSLELCKLQVKKILFLTLRTFTKVII